jgi:hypothetical protein
MYVYQVDVVCIYVVVGSPLPGHGGCGGMARWPAGGRYS